jgi:hypothetical protein
MFLIMRVECRLISRLGMVGKLIFRFWFEEDGFEEMD